MNEHSESDLKEMQTRRAMLATAGGLLLPAGLLALDGEEAEATKRARRRRRRRRKQVGWFGNDVIINFRNATSETLSYRYRNHYTGSGNAYRALDPGKESGFVTGMRPADLIMQCDLDIRLPDFPATGVNSSYMIRCKNYEVGMPDAQIWWYPDPRDHKSDNISGTRDMGEDTTFEITHRGYRFHVHRWTNGKEPLDNEDEWYTRFFVTMSNV